MAAPPLEHPLDHRPLGTSGIEVSAVSLGSWLTIEHMGADEGLAVMRAARDAGIDFLDDARYDDRTGRAPIPTGYSEVVFGRLFRAAGWRREDVVVANKLWLEFWPQESPAAELDASLGRMGFDYLDLAYCAPPPDGREIGELVVQLGALIASGKVRAWGVLNWNPDALSSAVRLAARRASRCPVRRSSRTASRRVRRWRIPRRSPRSTTRSRASAHLDSSEVDALRNLALNQGA